MKNNDYEMYFGSNGKFVEKITKFKELFYLVDKLYNDKDQAKEKRQWIFRGEKFKKCSQNEKENWNDYLCSSIERFYDTLPSNSNQIPIKGLEEMITISARRGRPLFPPRDNKDLSDFQVWSLLQHHGGLTRLTDWTYSFWVALYFAIGIEKWWSQNQKYIVWALDTKRMEAIYSKNDSNYTCPMYKKIFKRDEWLSNNLTLNIMDWNSDRFPILAVSPELFNDRLHNQNGLFLMPTNGDLNSKRGLKNLFLMAKEHNIEIPNLWRKIVIQFSCEDQYRQTLMNLMNMTIQQDILFPDLTGFSEGIGRQQYLISHQQD